MLFGRRPLALQWGLPFEILMAAVKDLACASGWGNMLELEASMLTANARDVFERAQWCV